MMLSAGEQDAFTRRHVALVRRLARWHMGRSRGWDRPDVESDAWEGLARAARGYDRARSGNEAAYVAACVRWAVLDGHRQRASPASVYWGAPVNDTIHPVPDGTGWLDLLDAVRRLPVREREAVTYTYLEGYRLREVAALSGVTESRVSQVRSRAIRRLRDSLA